MKTRVATSLLLILTLSLACSLPGAMPLDNNTAATMVAATLTAFAVQNSPGEARTSVPNSIPAGPSSLAICQDEACMANGLSLSYVVVTRPLFIDALTPFINWKSGQGYHVGVVTVDWLAQRFTARHLAESMKIGMHALRRQSGVQYALLVGDTEIERGNFNVNAVHTSYTLTHPWNVPTGFSRSSSSPPGDVLPGDVYFVDERDWDPQNTGLNPVPTQASGMAQIDASLYIGRWSVRKPEEIAPIFTKTQRFTPTNRIFFTRHNEGYYFPLEDVIRKCPNPPFPEWYCYEFVYAHQRLFGQNAPWLATEELVVDVNDHQQSSTLQQRLSGFDGVIVESYHGNYSYLAMPHSEILSSHDYRMLMTASCYVSAFYSGNEDTFNENVFKAALGPAIVVQPPNEYMFLMNLRAGQPVGQAFWRSGEYAYGYGAPILLLGDPSLQVFVPPTGN